MNAVLLFRVLWLQIVLAIWCRALDRLFKMRDTLETYNNALVLLEYISGIVFCIFKKNYCNKCHTD
jgi:hypothetical protein